MIFDRGGFIRTIDYLGFSKLPYKISKDKKPYREAETIIFKFDVSEQVQHDLKLEANMDIDVIRCNVFDLKCKDKKANDCTLEEEMKPVSHRPHVKKLLDLQEKSKKKHWLPQMGIEYYPFQR